MKYMKAFKEKFREYPVFTITDAKLFLEKKGASKEYVYTTIHNSLKSEVIKKITRGIYTFHEEITVVGFAFTPFYYGLHDALSWYNIWEQEVNPIVITPRKVRTGIRSFLGRNYLVRHIDASMFFGLDALQEGQYWIPVSDPEKTLIDFVYFKERIPGLALIELLNKIQQKRLSEYLDHVPLPISRRVRDLMEAHAVKTLMT